MNAAMPERSKGEVLRTSGWEQPRGFEPRRWQLSFLRVRALYVGHYGRVVKALDLKSNGLCPRRFESCYYRLAARDTQLFLPSAASVPCHHVRIVAEVPMLFSVEASTSDIDSDIPGSNPGRATTAVIAQWQCIALVMRRS